MAMEIERKFLLEQYPQSLIDRGELVVLSEQRIHQTYLAMDDSQEIRVRQIEDLDGGALSYTHTFKNGNGLAREEVEVDITQSIYEQMVNAFGYVPLTKNRVTAEWNSLRVEIDVYDQIRLAVLEVEFDSMEEAEAFSAPAWFGRDISSERQYSNKTVWRQLQANRPD